MSDNAHSFAGKYGLQNPMVLWLIGRVYGELVALTPEDIRRPLNVEVCREAEEQRDYETGLWSRVGDTICERPMRYRSSEWVCYEHKTPARRAHEMRLQEAPQLIDYGDGILEPFIGGVEMLVSLADREVDVTYREGVCRYEVR